MMAATQELQPLLPPDWRLDEEAAFLADMAVAVQGNEQGEPYPGYPSQEGRLYIPADALQYDEAGRPIFPSGPEATYTVYDHSVNPPAPRPASAFHDNGGPLPDDEAAKINWDGMATDSRGFPLHRLAIAMVTDPAIGLIIGPGYFYHPGKKQTADAGMMAQGVPAQEGVNEFGVTPAVQASPEQVAMGGLYLSILLVRRRDTGQFAQPGGNIEPGETAKSAALREAQEETGMAFESATSLGRRLAADPRLTSCTEAETELFAVDAGYIPAEQPEPEAEEDAESALWVIADRNLLVARRFYGAHQRMFYELVDWYQREHNVTVMENGLIVPNG